ncbi:MAG TPA: HAMP domain-containing sensor histidine kinase [Chitinophagaceae bacterium]|nr:HAMP domain-containing sensor histidine kinase [Chitinophagaceae bacterium]
MKAIIDQLPLSNQHDLYRVHELAMQLAGQSGLLPIQQMQFACEVTSACHENIGQGHTLTLGIYHGDGAQRVLRATILPSKWEIERDIDPAGADWKVKQTSPVVAGETNDHTEASYRDMKQFTFALSHDLKNSLTKLKLALSLVEEEDMPALIHNYIQIIHRSAGRLENTMLALNKIIELGHSAPANVKSVSLARIFTDLSDEFSESLLKMKASVNTDFTRVAEVNYVEVYLRSIFSNLISNAVKYAAPDRALRLDITVDRHEGDVLLVFSDNGEGIDMEKSGKKLFQPFSRLTNNGDGTGNGLYIIRNMVERNGGSITVESRKGEGTVFRVVLKEYKVKSQN